MKNTANVDDLVAYDQTLPAGEHLSKKQVKTLKAKLSAYGDISQLTILLSLNYSNTISVVASKNARSTTSSRHGTWSEKAKSPCKENLDERHERLVKRAKRAQADTLADAEHQLWTEPIVGESSRLPTDLTSVFTSLLGNQLNHG